MAASNITHVYIDASTPAANSEDEDIDEDSEVGLNSPTPSAGLIEPGKVPADAPADKMYGQLEHIK